MAVWFKFVLFVLLIILSLRRSVQYWFDPCPVNILDNQGPARRCIICLLEDAPAFTLIEKC